MDQITETTPIEPITIETIKKWHREIRMARSKNKVKFTTRQRPTTGESNKTETISTSSPEVSTTDEIDIPENPETQRPYFTLQEEWGGRWEIGLTTRS